MRAGPVDGEGEVIGVLVNVLKDRWRRGELEGEGAGEGPAVGDDGGGGGDEEAEVGEARGAEAVVAGGEALGEVNGMR